MKWCCLQCLHWFPRVHLSEMFWCLIFVKFLWHTYISKFHFGEVVCLQCLHLFWHTYNRNFSLVHLLPHSVQLGNFSYDWNLAILQVGPQSCIIFDWYPPARPPTHPTPLGRNWITTIGGVSRNILKWAEMCLEGVLKVYVWCPEGGVSKVSERHRKGCLEGVQKEGI